MNALAPLLIFTAFFSPSMELPKSETTKKIITEEQRLARVIEYITKDSESMETTQYADQKLPATKKKGQPFTRAAKRSISPMVIETVPVIHAKRTKKKDPDE